MKTKELFDTALRDEADNPIKGAAGENQGSDAGVKGRPSVSVIIPALNEAGNIANVVSLVLGSLSRQCIFDFELILVDGGSKDGTGAIMDELAKKNEHIHAVHNFDSRGLGHSFRYGLSRASKEYVGFFPGDNETLQETMDVIFQEIGKYDAIIPYTVNPWVRPVGRRILSVLYTKFFNALFGLHLKYFNGPCFFRRRIVETVTMSSDSPAYMAEILVQLLKKGNITYREVPMYIRAREYGASSVLTLRNVLEIGKTAIEVFSRVRKRPDV